MNRKRRFFFALVVGLMVWAGVFLAGVWPWFTRVDAQLAALQDRRREAALIVEKLRTGATLAGVGAELARDRERLERTFLVESSTREFINEVETLVNLHRLQHVLTVSDDARRQAGQKADGEGAAFTFNLDLTGTFPDTVRFLAALEQGVWWLNVDGVQFAQAGTDGTVRTSVAMRVFSIKQP
ncbi:hypothetical protein HYW67_03900 [Candidatus Parcubacteria bacterium]|nr:hypothetical protein [Candidatus Parcubacteria bacterium]